MKEASQIITLSLAGIKVEFEINVSHQYENHFRFNVVDNNTKGVVLDGMLQDGRTFLSYIQDKSVKLFYEVLENKTKTEIKKLAKSLKIKIKIR